jgi:hypothetical protein
MEFSIELAINNLSLGQCSLNILKEMYKRKLMPNIFPIGESNINYSNTSNEFKEWLTHCANNSLASYSKNNTCFKLWHIGGSQSFPVSSKQVLLTFHECSEATPIERNIVRNTTKTLFSSNYSKEVFEKNGCDNVGSFTLGFDADSFSQTKAVSRIKDRIVFGLGGKLEKRKNHLKVLKAWAEKYGNNPKYLLNCALYNPFMSPELQSAAISQALGEKKYWNINILPYMESNAIYNEFLNANDIFIAMGNEGWGLPEFQSAAIGKYVILLNCAGHKDWANSENSILIEPNGMEQVDDGVFFKTGMPFNQGSFFTYSDEDFINSCELGIQKFSNNAVNESGLELQKTHTWARTVDAILENI